MQEVLLSLFQALQLVALGPCLFIVFFLLVTVRRLPTVLVPCLYFLSLSASFILPLLPLVELDDSAKMFGGLLFVESLTPALSFLLILQFIYGRPPLPAYWLILALPVVGGSSFIYGMLNFSEVCLRERYCLPATSLKILYQIAGSGLIFLLLIAHYSRRAALFPDERNQHRHWLIIALILLNLQLMALDLALITNHLTSSAEEQAATIIRMGFIYLVLTSLFRVFDRSVEVDMARIPTLSGSRSKPEDHWIVEKLERTMERDCAYRDCGSLEKLAMKTTIPEHQISRVINAHYGMSFSEFVNQYRIDEVTRRLGGEDTAITTIAYEAGFGSIASFNRVFKEKTGMTPSEYRRQHTPKEGKTLTVSS